jgi:hypothetical protein
VSGAVIIATISSSCAPTTINGVSV